MIQLAHGPAKLRALRSRLERGRPALPLFDTPLFCRHLEMAYQEMWRRYSLGEPPETFRVERTRAPAR